MNTDAEKEVFSVIESINRMCETGEGLDQLDDLIHDQMVTVIPSSEKRMQGKDVNLKGYQDFISQMNVKTMNSSNEQVDVLDSTAVATYNYNCQWEYQGKSFDQTGQELVVFTHEDDRWQILWRALTPKENRVDDVETKVTSDCPSSDIRQRCLHLIENSPACQLTTIDSDGFPHITAMNNLRYATQYPGLKGLFENQANDFVLYMSTSMDSNKMARMQANPKVAAYFCDAGQFHGVNLGGEIEVITDKKLKDEIWQDGWTIYYPNGPEGPEYGVIKLVPTVVKGWSSVGPFELDVKG